MLVFSFGYDGQEERHHKIRWVQFSDQPGLGSHLPIVSHHCMGRSRQSWESKKYSGAFVSCRMHRLAIFIRRERMGALLLHPPITLTSSPLQSTDAGLLHSCPRG